MTHVLTCPKCSRRNVLSEDDAVLFYPRFFCLSCGEKIAIPLPPEEYLKLVREVDRDRSVKVDGKAPQAPVPTLARNDTPGDTGG